jgi:site-specific recombinase XerD
MAKLIYFHDTRSGSGEFPLKLRITHHSKSVHINIGVKLAIEQWDGEKVINHPKEKSLNDYLITKMTLAQSAIMKYGLVADIEKLSAADIKSIVQSNGETAKKEKGHLFAKYFEECIRNKSARKTALSYMTSLKKMREVDSSLDDKVFEEIDEAYIRSLDDAWSKAGITTNSRAVYMRNIRSVFNDAIDDELTTCYPFRKFSIKKTPTKKRNLSVEELRLLRDYPIVNDFQKKYRDIFMLCFYLRGINAKDLFGLKSSNVRLGRINYVRAKTGKFYSVKIEPEAKALLNKYKGKNYLVDICDGAKDEAEFIAKYEGFLQRMDRGLKKIGPYTRKGLGGKKEIKAIFPFLSQYWCRHTSATLMAKLGYSNEIIATSLGHEYGNKTTNIYIEYNEEEVDKANRALIDYVNAE